MVCKADDFASYRASACRLACELDWAPVGLSERNAESKSPRQGQNRVYCLAVNAFPATGRLPKLETKLSLFLQCLNCVSDTSGDVTLPLMSRGSGAER